MFLVLRQDPASPSGWTPVVMSGAASAKEAAGEAHTGRPGDLAVIEWTPEFFTAEQTVTVTKLTVKQFEARRAVVSDPERMEP